MTPGSRGFPRPRAACSRQVDPEETFSDRARNSPLASVEFPVRRSRVCRSFPGRGGGSRFAGLAPGLGTPFWAAWRRRLGGTGTTPASVTPPDLFGNTSAVANTEGHPGRLTPPCVSARGDSNLGRYGDWRLVLPNAGAGPGFWLVRRTDSASGSLGEWGMGAAEVSSLSVDAGCPVRYSGTFPPPDGFYVERSGFLTLTTPSPPSRAIPCPRFQLVPLVRPWLVTRRSAASGLSWMPEATSWVDWRPRSPRS